jgi:hypothetical protein
VDADRGFVLAGAELSRAQREAFLDQQCRNDAQVREEVLSLWQHDTPEEPPLIDALNAGAASVLIDDAPIGHLLGPYCIERKIGGGGTSVVYFAGRGKASRT